MRQDWATCHMTSHANQLQCLPGSGGHCGDQAHSNSLLTAVNVGHACREAFDFRYAFNAGWLSWVGLASCLGLPNDSNST